MRWLRDGPLDGAAGEIAMTISPLSATATPGCRCMVLVLATVLAAGMVRLRAPLLSPSAWREVSRFIVRLGGRYDALLLSVIARVVWCCGEHSTVARS